MKKLDYSSVQKTHRYMTVLTILTMISVIFILAMIEPQPTQAAGGNTTIIVSQEKEDEVLNYFATGKTVSLIDSSDAIRSIIDENKSVFDVESKIKELNKATRQELLEKRTAERAKELEAAKLEKERKEKEEKCKKYTTTDYVNLSSKPESGEEFIKEVIMPGEEFMIININEEGWAETIDGDYIPAAYLRSAEAQSEPEEQVMASRGADLDFLYENSSTTTSMSYVSSDFNVYSPSGATVEEMYTITSNNPGMSGLESAAIEIEQVYGINAYFVMAIAAWESDRGRSDLACYSNNFHGLYDSSSGTWMTFASPSESAHMSARSISTYEAVTINNIGYIYCPDGNTQHWIDNIVTMMNEFIGYNK